MEGYKASIMAGCTDHVVNLVSNQVHKEFGKRFPFLRPPNGYYNDALSYLCTAVSDKLRKGKMLPLFQGLCLCCGVRPMPFYRVTSGRYQTIDNFCCDLLRYFPVIFLIFWRFS